MSEEEDASAEGADPEESHEEERVERALPSPAKLQEWFTEATSQRPKVRERGLAQIRQCSRGR